MPSLKETRVRIQSVISTQQITKAMKMVAAAKLRRSQDAIIQLRPYSKKLGVILNNLNTATDGEFESPFSEVRPVEKVLIIPVTSDRGLCGAFNSTVTKAVTALLNTEYQAQLAAGQVEIMCVGKKGLDFFTKRNFNTTDTFVGLFQGLSFEKVRKAAEYAMDGFQSKRYDKVVIVYNEFKNVATQILKTETLLPLEKVDQSEKVSQSNYLMEPSPAHIIGDIIPKSVKIQFFKAILESNASENGARMTAMDKATENAGELLKDLKLQYNRGRQAAITKEILEIVGGAEALSGK